MVAMAQATDWMPMIEPSKTFLPYLTPGHTPDPCGARKCGGEIPFLFARIFIPTSDSDRLHIATTVTVEASKMNSSSWSTNTTPPLHVTDTKKIATKPQASATTS